MASWSTKRRFGYFLAFVVLVVFAVGLPGFLFFYEAPTCADGQKNGSERGIDCGGVCVKLCPADFVAPRALWSYSVAIAPGVYNALAYAENPNQSVYASAVGYTFRLYDSAGLLIAEKKGKTLVPTGQKFAIFDGGIRTGQRIPLKTTFEFGEVSEWKLGKSVPNPRILSIDLEQNDSPRAEVKVSNDSTNLTLSSLTAFIIIYDSADNRMAFSKTLVDRIAPRQTETFYFTWPSAFPRPAVRKEVLFVAH